MSDVLIEACVTTIDEVEAVGPDVEELRDAGARGSWWGSYSRMAA